MTVSTNRTLEIDFQNSVDLLQSYEHQVQISNRLQCIFTWLPCCHFTFSRFKFKLMVLSKPNLWGLIFMLRIPLFSKSFMFSNVFVFCFFSLTCQLLPELLSFIILASHSPLHKDKDGNFSIQNTCNFHVPKPDHSSWYQITCVGKLSLGNSGRILLATHKFLYADHEPMALTLLLHYHYYFLVLVSSFI